MNYKITGLLLFISFSGVFAEDKPGLPPWKISKPWLVVRKELYRKHPRPGAAALTTRQYVGPTSELMEWQAEETMDDVWDKNMARWSLDNAKTWSDFIQQKPSTNVRYKGVVVWEGGICRQFDPASGLLVEMWLRQILDMGKYHCFTYYRTSKDLGKSWSKPIQLRYEPGDEFDPDDPLKKSFLNKNQGYCGSNILISRDGILIHCLAHANAFGDPENDKRSWKLGSVCFMGKWNAGKMAYDWIPGQRIEIGIDVSSRGLMEPEVAELSDGRLLVVWRGSNTGKTPGRKFFSLSSDGGRTLSEVKEWKYDDGSSFYSPSSFHRMIRHGKTKKLYWVGNICQTPPSGNSPRYPLVIAEVEEKIPALMKNTVIAIDDRKPDQGDGVQFSNFSLLENRETHDLELFLTTYGQEKNAKDWATADSYKYILSINK